MHRKRYAELTVCAALAALIATACEREQPSPPAAAPEEQPATPGAEPATEPAAGPRPAALEPEVLRAVELPAEPGLHWVYVHDVNFDSMIDGRSYLVDADRGALLGLISTGYGGASLIVGPAHRALYSVETYYSRGSRGERSDMVTIYDTRTLAPTAEIAIPPKRAMTMPFLANARLSDDGRFVLVFNMTPATSVTVVDLQAGKALGEIEAPGCSLIYPGPGRRFVMLCGDGSLLDVEFDETGKALRKERTQKFFEPATDLVTEKAVRRGDTWYFLSFGGMVHPLDLSKDTEFGEPWSLLDEATRADSWLPGGLQIAAVHATSGQLFVLMHQGGAASHKDPGSEVWVYDLASHERLRRITLKAPAMSVQVSQDDAPLLYTIFMGSRDLEVYDARSGEHLRSVPEIGFTPTLLLTP